MCVYYGKAATYIVLHENALWVAYPKSADVSWAYLDTDRITVDLDNAR